MNVLVSGASMAGLSAAYWFAHLGHQVTVVERSTACAPAVHPSTCADGRSARRSGWASSSGSMTRRS